MILQRVRTGGRSRDTTIDSGLSQVSGGDALAEASQLILLTSYKKTLSQEVAEI